MNKTLFFAVIAFALLSGAQLSHAEKDGYYRWKDDKGLLHFTQQPPIGRKYEFVESSATTHFGSGEAVTEDDTEPAVASQAEGSSGVPANESMEVLPAKDPKLCEQAQGNLQSLAIPGARIRSTRPDGSSYFLNPEEIETQRLRAKEAVEIYCN